VIEMLHTSDQLLPVAVVLRNQTKAYDMCRGKEWSNSTPPCYVFRIYSKRGEASITGPILGTQVPSYRREA